MKWLRTMLSTVVAASQLCACGGSSSSRPALNELPSGLTTPVVTSYPASAPGAGDTAETQDLLTAGLGKTALQGVAPTFADPANPTPAELRRRAIYTNYRAVLDITTAGGFGTLYGPNIAVDGTPTSSEGLVPGKEYLAFADDGTGTKNVTVLVQIPTSFDSTKACIVAAPSSGSRGVYGAIGSAGEWGLKHGCAVAYTDAGKGTGYHDLMADQVNLVDGRLVARASAASAATFAADLSGASLASFNATYPNRIAYKHVYSQQNPEKDWGRNVLDSIRFAYWALNEEYGAKDAASGKKLRSIVPGNTIVIASSISNGGAASLQAAEQDTEGLIDGVAVAEPNAQPADMTGITVQFGGSAVGNAGKPLIDYFTYRMIYEPCAAIAAGAQAANGARPGWLGFGTSPLGSALTQVAGQELQVIGANRCQSLADKGLITGTDTPSQATAALEKLMQYGWTDPTTNALHASHYRLADMYVAYGYVNAYGKFSVGDRLCGFSLAFADAAGNVAAQPATRTQLFGTSNGLNTGADVIYDDSVGGAKLYHVGVSPSTGRMDGALDGVLCLRSMVTGADAVTGTRLTGTALANSQRVQAGVRDVLLSGKLHGLPVIVVAGRSDALLPVNHAGRAYLAFNSKMEGTATNLHYYEITNGQHFDAFLPNAASGGVQGYDTLLVPVHYYFVKSMDLMWAKLNSNAALPPSQVVRTTPRGGTAGSAPAITTANVPPILASPAASDAIKASAGTGFVPN
jgi:hydroxybutyrate-dimer hydrolase